MNVRGKPAEELTLWEGTSRCSGEAGPARRGRAWVRKVSRSAFMAARFRKPLARKGKENVRGLSPKATVHFCTRHEPQGTRVSVCELRIAICRTKEGG